MNSIVTGTWCSSTGDCTYRLLYEELKSEQYELVAKQEIEKLKKENEDLRYVYLCTLYNSYNSGAVHLLFVDKNEGWQVNELLN